VLAEIEQYYWLELGWMAEVAAVEYLRCLARSAMP
jgi:hypothetical protein